MLIMGHSRSNIRLQTASSRPATERQTTPELVVDLTSATEFELEEITGLGRADAEWIVENRPYRSREELLAKQIVPEDLFEKIKDNLSPL